RIKVALVAAIAVGFFASLMLQERAPYRGNYSGFLHLSRSWAESTPFLQERPDLAGSLITYDAGYDGQFMYLMAFDPLLQRFKDNVGEYGRVVDDPPYRYGRVGFPLLARAVSGGAADRYPAALIWLTVLAHVPLAWALAVMASRAGASPYVALAYLAIP